MAAAGCTQHLSPRFTEKSSAKPTLRAGDGLRRGPHPQSCTTTVCLTLSLSTQPPAGPGESWRLQAAPLPHTQEGGGHDDQDQQQGHNQPYDDTREQLRLVGLLAVLGALGKREGKGAAELCPSPPAASVPPHLPPPPAPAAAAAPAPPGLSGSSCRRAIFRPQGL